MNTYKVSFTRENGTTGFDHFTAATEAQARKDFRECYRHGNGTIDSVELVSTDTPATKEQERKAVEKIRKIIAELGNGSYVGTALEGCLEVAESNIENDFGESMKDSLQHSEKQLAAAKENASTLSTELEKAKAEVERLTAELEQAKKAHLTIEDFEACMALAKAEASDNRSKAEQQAEIIVECADSPESPAFAEAVRKNRAYKKAAERAEQIVSNLEYYMSV